MWEPGLPPRFAAVQGWELATPGDPLLCVGHMVVCHPDPAPVLTPTMALGGAFLAPGFPTTTEMPGHYAQVSGRDLSGLGWFAAMAAWKVAGLYDFSHRQGKDAFFVNPELSPPFISVAKCLARG